MLGTNISTNGSTCCKNFRQSTFPDSLDGSGKVKQIGEACPQDIDTWADRELWVPSFKTDKFQAATGAGDSTIAGFLTALIRGFAPVDSLRIANILGWQNVQALDTLSGIKDWQATLDFVKDKNQEHNPLEINCDNWQYCQDQQMFFGPNDKGGK